MQRGQDANPAWQRRAAIGAMIVAALTLGAELAAVSGFTLRDLAATVMPKNAPASPAASTPHQPATTPTPTPQDKTPPGTVETAISAPDTHPPTTLAVGETTYLADLEPYRGGWEQSAGEGEDIAIEGRLYPQSVSLEDCFGRDGPFDVEYTLNHRYKDLRAVVGMADGSGSEWRSQFDVIVEGAVRESFVVSEGRPHRLSVDLRGASTLRLHITTLSGGGCGASEPYGPSLGSPRMTS